MHDTAVSAGDPPPAAPPRSDLIDADPRDTIARLLSVEEERQRDRRADLATLRNALARLHDLDLPRDVPAIAPITVELAPTLLRSLNDETTGPVRNAAISAAVGSGVTPDLVAHTQEAIRGGLEQRTVYDDRVLQTPQGRQWVSEWAEVGERQRVLPGVPSEFAIYGEAAVVGVGTWGDVAADYVVVRDPMLVQAFIALFDRMWDQAAPIPAGRSGDDEEDEHLLQLLGRGLKDEAIARYLGWSLRTVRRRVARLMVDLGARTRFQLGAEAVRAGHLDAPDLPPPRSPGRGPTG
jgi:DNA-binding CsgD family transcriptional regulator